MLEHINKSIVSKISANLMAFSGHTARKSGGIYPAPTACGYSYTCGDGHAYTMRCTFQKLTTLYG
uniref:AlNc14C66G4680 protein n=1 Tax=Albugo laibachii Nc14 TaxID=890382 RepID=F0WDG0_9STRA|nr:AlNc14C66G4680 [Albugo laibachii Nc14]|eukprot:CCA19232.1 AlNc14C66G4680 [Albugo laibachii Nc14]